LGKADRGGILNQSGEKWAGARTPKRIERRKDLKRKDGWAKQKSRKRELRKQVGQS